jgi:ParB-like nuclease domain
MRALESVLLRPEQVMDHPSLGPVVGFVGVVVGFGSNYLNAIASDGRLVLNNGHHRAYALRQLGVTHVPCVVQKVTTRQELAVVGAGALLRNPEAYLTAPRPPVLKDYFDPRLSRTVRLVPTKKHVQVSFTIEEKELPA